MFGLDLIDESEYDLQMTDESECNLQMTNAYARSNLHTENMYVYIHIETR